MQRIFLALALGAAVGTPFAALAQPGPGPGPMGSPAPELRNRMERMHDQARTDAFAALSPDHRTQVQAIVAQVSAGTLPPRDATRQIDGLLTADEASAVGNVMRTTFAQMRPDAPPPSSSATPPPGVAAGPPPASGDGPRRHRFSAGRFLLMVSLTPDQMRALRSRAGTDATPPAAPKS